jgi:DNA-binding beta-propeller fold protein YncE
VQKLIASVCLTVSLAAVAQQAPIPAPNDILGRPFAIRNRWVIGGNGSWDYLTLDPAASQLFVTHQSRVQVVDITSGQIAGEVTGLGNAHAVVLDPDRPIGYVTDSQSNTVTAFDRRSFQRVRAYPLRATPRALVLEPQTGLLFAFGTIPASILLLPRGYVHDPHHPAPYVPDPCRSANDYIGSSTRIPQTLITILDPETQSKLAEVQTCGATTAAVAGGEGSVYFGISDTSQVGRLDAAMLVNEIRGKDKSALLRLRSSVNGDGSLFLDVREYTQVHTSGIPLAANLPEFRPFDIGSDCRKLNAIAVDSAHNRLFAACANQIFRVVSTDLGRTIASLAIGPGVDALAFDKSRGLIFTANGDGYGSVTIIRQSLNDDYTVGQNLPTMERARTLALDASTGSLYLVTDLHGTDLRNTPANGIGKLTMNPVDNSFQVLVIGN